MAEKVRKYIKAIQRRFGVRSRVERLMEAVPNMTRTEAQRLIALREGHGPEEPERLATQTEPAGTQVKSKGGSMTSGTKFHVRRVISMAAFVVAVYFAVAAYEPGNSRNLWGPVSGRLSPGHVAAAVGFLCVTYLLWPKKQGLRNERMATLTDQAASQQTEQDIGLVLTSGFNRLNALDPLSDTYTQDSVQIWKEMFDTIVPPYATKAVQDGFSAQDEQKK